MGPEAYGDWIMSGTALLTGTSAGSVSMALKERFPASFGPAGGVGAVPEAAGRQLIVLCPSDGIERSRLEERARMAPASGRTLCVVFSDFDAGPPSPGCPICLRSGDYALHVLGALPGYQALLRMEGSMVRMSLWQCAGALLPFFVHNMNNLLARVMGNAELARMYADRPAACREKLDSALAGVEDLRRFIQGLADMSAATDRSAGWNRGSLAVLERMGRMFSGRSVEFEFDAEGGMLPELPFPAGRVDLAAGLAAASAAVMVNGSGRIVMKVSAEGGCVVFSVEWSAVPGRSGLVPHSSASSAELMAAAAACCAASGFSLVLDEWIEREGRASVLVDPGKERIPSHE